MSDFHLVDSQGWEYDLQSVYAAYMGYFQLNGIPWYERSWGHLFNTFEGFLSFSWPVITATDAYTGRAHIVTRMTSIGAFVKMIRTRFGDTLPLVDNVVKVHPLETHQRHLRTISDYSSYKKLHATLRAVRLSSLKARVRLGEPRAIQELWDLHDKSFLAIDFESWERNAAAVLEWGYATVRCGHLDALGTWPPLPEENYRRGHYIVSEYADKFRNKYNPTFPRQYAYGESQVVSKNKMPQIIQAIISLASPDSETQANTVVLVSHSATEDLLRLEEMKIKLPHNLLVIDVTVYESCLFKAGLRGAMLDAKTGAPRQPGSLLSLRSLLHSLHVPLDFVLHNAGNDAFACLLAFQMLVDPKNTQVPTPRTNPPAIGITKSMTFGSLPLPSPTLLVHPMTVAPMPRSHSASNFQHLNTGEGLTLPRRSSTSPNHRLSTGDVHAGDGAPDEEGRIDDTPDKLKSATVG